MPILSEHPQPPAVDRLGELAGGDDRRRDPGLDVAEGLCAENRHQKQKPVRRITRRQICREVYPQQMNNLSINIWRGSKNNALATHLRFSRDVRLSGLLQSSDVLLNYGIWHGVRKGPNDLKLSDCGVRRGTCMVGGKAAAEAGAVTHGAVRCSAWLGVAVIWNYVPNVLNAKKTPT